MLVELVVADIGFWVLLCSEFKFESRALLGDVVVAQKILTMRILKTKQCDALRG